MPPVPPAPNSTRTEAFTAATSALQQSHEAVDQRDYRLALSRAVDAYERAQDAAKLAADGKAKVRSEAEMVVSAANAAALALDARLKAAEAAHMPARELAQSRQHGEGCGGSAAKSTRSAEEWRLPRRSREREGAGSADSRADYGRSTSCRLPVLPAVCVRKG